MEKADIVTEADIKLFGRVQGVNLRYTIKRYAESLAVRGYIINREDGSVLVVAQGNRKNVEKFISWLKKSPGFSQVDNLKVEWKKPRASYHGFEILRPQGYVLDKAKGLLNLGRKLIENKGKIPTHIIIIPDGNRRWAREKGLQETFGHYTSASDDRIIGLIRESQREGVKYLSIWGFSTENWNRSEREIKSIFSLVLKKIEVLKEYAHKNRVRFRHLGRKDRMPKNLVHELKKLEDETKDYRDFNVQLLLDYGGRDEIVRAVSKIIKSGQKKIDEDSFKKYLDSRDIPDPDLIIRTSGEKRTSGVMPFQAAYAEFYFADVYFPEFDSHELKKAIKSFSGRIRRFGGTAKEDLQNGRK